MFTKHLEAGRRDILIVYVDNIILRGDHHKELLLAPRLDDPSSTQYEGTALAPCAHQGRRLRQIEGSAS